MAKHIELTCIDCKSKAIYPARTSDGKRCNICDSGLLVEHFPDTEATICELCPDEDTNRCKTCSKKSRSMAAGLQRRVRK